MPTTDDTTTNDTTADNTATNDPTSPSQDTTNHTPAIPPNPVPDEPTCEDTYPDGLSSPDAHTSPVDPTLPLPVSPNGGPSPENPFAGVCEAPDSGSGSEGSEPDGSEPDDSEPEGSDPDGGEDEDPENCCDGDSCCGPDVTVWFNTTLVKAQNVSRNHPLPLPSFMRFWRSLKYEEAGLSQGACGTGNCQNSVSLCESCIDATELGNIAFGYAAPAAVSPSFTLLFDPVAVALWGGFFAEVINGPNNPGRGFHSFEEIASALIGAIHGGHIGTDPGLCNAIQGNGLIPVNQRAAQLDNLIDSIESVNNFIWAG